MNDWWSDFWINEGLTYYYADEVVREAVRQEVLPSSFLPTYYLYSHYDNYAITQKVHTVRANEHFYGFNMALFYKARNVAFMLDTAMEGNLSVCLGLAMENYTFRSLSGLTLNKELSNCPHSNLNVVNFMQYWLYEEMLPILKLELQNETAIFTYSLLCDLDAIKNASCETHKKYTPQFAIKFQDQDYNLLQKVQIISDFPSEIKLNFSVEDNQLFFVNAFEGRNVLVQYPEFVYEEFFNWIESEKFTYDRPDNHFLLMFIMDMLQLSARELIKSDWTIKIRNKPSELKKMGAKRYVEDIIDDISTHCFDQSFFLTLTGNYRGWDNISSLAPVSTSNSTRENCFVDTEENMNIQLNNERLRTLIMFALNGHEFWANLYGIIC